MDLVIEPGQDGWTKIEAAAVVNITIKLKYLSDFLPLVKRLPSHDWCGIVFETITQKDGTRRRKLKFVQTSENTSGEKVMITVWEEAIFRIGNWEDCSTGAYFFMTDLLAKCADKNPQSLVQLLCLGSASDISRIMLKFPNSSGSVSIYEFSVPSLEQSLHGKFVTRCGNTYVKALSTPQLFSKFIQQQVESYKICSSVRQKKEIKTLYGEFSILNLNYITVPESQLSEATLDTIMRGVFCTSFTSYLENCIVPAYIASGPNNVFKSVESNYGQSFKISFLGDSMAELSKKLHSTGFQELEFICGFASLGAQPNKTHNEPMSDDEEDEEEEGDREPAAIKLKSYIRNGEGVKIVKFGSIFHLQELDGDFGSQELMSHIISDQDVKDKFDPFMTNDSKCFDRSALYLVDSHKEPRKKKNNPRTEAEDIYEFDIELSDELDIEQSEPKKQFDAKSLWKKLGQKQSNKRAKPYEDQENAPKKKRIVFNDSSVDSEEGNNEK